MLNSFEQYLQHFFRGLARILQIEAAEKKLPLLVGETPQIFLPVEVLHFAECSRG